MTSGGNNFSDFPENQAYQISCDSPPEKNYFPIFSGKHPASACQWSGRRGLAVYTRATRPNNAIYSWLLLHAKILCRTTAIWAGYA